MPRKFTVSLKTNSMKNIRCLITTVFALFMGTSILSAQTTQPESRLSAGVGFLTAPDIMEVTASFSSIIISGGTLYTDNVSSTGAAFVQYDRCITPGIMVGVGLTFSRLERDLMAKILDEPLKVGTGRSDYYSLMGRFHHNWLKTDLVRIYYGAGFGFTIIHDQADIDARYKPTNTSQNAFHVAFQITPFGIEVGRKLSVFAEGGLGFNGLIAAGLSYRF